MTKIKNIAILGSTGSIGTQALEVVEANPHLFEISVLTAQNNADLLVEQAIKFRPQTVVIANELLFDKVNSQHFHLGIKVYAGILVGLSLSFYWLFDLIKSFLVN